MLGNIPPVTSYREELNPLPTSWKSCICMTIWIAVHDSVTQKNIHCLRGVPRVFCVLLSASRCLLLGDSDPCICCLHGEFRRFPRYSCSWSERSLCGLTWPFPSWGNNNHIKQLNAQICLRHPEVQLPCTCLSSMHQTVVITYLHWRGCSAETGIMGHIWFIWVHYKWLVLQSTTNYTSVQFQDFKFLWWHTMYFASRPLPVFV